MNTAAIFGTIAAVMTICLLVFVAEVLIENKDNFSNWREFFRRKS